MGSMLPEKSMRTILIALLFLSVPVLASDYSSYSSFVGDGAFTTNIEHQWGSGDDLQNNSPDYTGGAAASGIVTLNGIMGYESSTNINADTGHKYVFSRDADINAGAVYFDSLAMEDSAEPEEALFCDANGNILPPDRVQNNSTLVSPGQYPYYQSAVGEVAGFMQSGRYKSDKTVIDADLAFSTRAYWEGAGLYTNDFKAGAYAGADKNSSTMNYRNGVREHTFLSSNQSGGWEVAEDKIWKDFSNPFVQKTEDQPANETVNETVEED